MSRKKSSGSIEYENKYQEIDAAAENSDYDSVVSACTADQDKAQSSNTQLQQDESRTSLIHHQENRPYLDPQLQGEPLYSLHSIASASFQSVRSQQPQNREQASHEILALPRSNIDLPGTLARLSLDISKSEEYLPAIPDSSTMPKTDVVPIQENSNENNTQSNSAGLQRRSTVTTAVNHYGSLENTPGFIGSVAIAFAAIPNPKHLLENSSWYSGSDSDDMVLEDGSRPISLVTPAADVEFKHEHTHTQINKRRFKAIGYLLIEYAKLALKYVMTLKGFAVTLYFLLVIAFGGMLFLLLLNAAPAMSKVYGPDDKVHSPRQIWIEIDSQILNALFSITGLGLLPLRSRDLYFWIRGRYLQDSAKNKKILKIHSNWFWDGFTSDWKLLLVILLFIFNSIFQVLLCFVMWHFTRFNRPSWTTGTLIAVSFLCNIIAGIVMFWEARRIEKYSFQTGIIREPGVSLADTKANEKSRSMKENAINDGSAINDIGNSANPVMKPKSENASLFKERYTMSDTSQMV